MHEMLSRRMGDRDLADDLFQTAMLRAHRSRAGFRSGGGDRDAEVFAWFRGIMLDTVADHVRHRLAPSQGRARQLERANEAQSDSAPPRLDPVLVPRERDVIATRRLWDAIVALPLVQRKVAVVRLIDVLSAEEIARLVGRSPATPGRVRLLRAVQRLRQAVDGT